MIVNEGANLLARMNFTTLCVLAPLFTSVSLSHAAAVSTTLQILPPLGTSINLKESDFAGSSSYTLTNRIVTTSYFYWYDVYSEAHLINSDHTDALTDHPPTLTGFSYRSKAWHRTQLLDMIAAGIDVLLPVYWGAPSERTTNRPPAEESWSYAGLIPLVLAREELMAEGKQPPRIGMFYDTSTLQFNSTHQHIDLTTEYGRRWFYESVRDFFSLIPPKHWAMIDGKPILFLYSASFAVRHDQSCIDYLRTQFALEFGGRMPFIVREISWNAQTEQVYAWGGALGLKNPGVASLGPGYDHSAVPGRTPLVVNRENGDFFSRNWISFLRRPSNLMTVETWNEFHEGTDIAHSKEYGRLYLELNRKYADMFKQGITPPLPHGPFTGVRCLNIWLGATNREEGLRQIESADGVTAPDLIAGSAARGVRATPNLGRYIYFKIDDSFKWAPKMDVALTVEYFDAAAGELGVEFDGSDPNAPFRGAYTASGTRVTLSGSKTWKTATFRLLDGVFMNSQNSGADFRLTVSAPEFYVRKVQLVRPGLSAAKYSPQEGFHLALFGEADRQYAIESSTNLTEWHPMALAQGGTCGEEYTDATAVGKSRAWYRALLIP